MGLHRRRRRRLSTAATRWLPAWCRLHVKLTKLKIKSVAKSTTHFVITRPIFNQIRAHSSLGPIERHEERLFRFVSARWRPHRQTRPEIGQPAHDNQARSSRLLRNFSSISLLSESIKLLWPAVHSQESAEKFYTFARQNHEGSLLILISTEAIKSNVAVRVAAAAARQPTARLLQPPDHPEASKKALEADNK